MKCRERKLEKEEGRRLEEEEEVLYLETQVSLVGGEKHQARIEQVRNTIFYFYREFSI